MLYNKTKAASLLNVSVKTLERAVADKGLKAHIIGTVTRFTLEDLEAYAGCSLITKEEKPSLAKGGPIPRDILKELAAEMRGICHGTVSLTIHLRDYKPRFVVGRERSFLDDDDEDEA
jgi:excisionase family DNA binding protein